MEHYREWVSSEFDKIVEIVSKQLYFGVLKGFVHTKKLRNSVDILYLSVDGELKYSNYYLDFGPFNISCLYKFCTKLNKYIQYANGKKKIVFYTTSDPEKKVNAAYLIGSFSVIYLKVHPKDVYKMLENAAPYKNFLDASQFPCQFTIKLTDCLQAISKALVFNFFDFNDFDAAEYDMYDTLKHGDLNWLVPRKFLAFIGPTDNEYLNGHAPEYYVKYFLKNDVKTVIRLNNRMYNASVFTQVGIDHHDLIFPDGTTPPKEVLIKFLHITENAPAAIAVHCKAGLGRTGSLIGAYLIKHYRMTATEAIAWMRICRPGSVIGQQQGWLEKIESWLWRTGCQYRVKIYGDGDKIPRHKYGIYSKIWPIEREKLIREARKKLQNTFTNSHIENFATRQKRQTVSVERIPKIKTNNYEGENPTERNSFRGISKLLSSVHGLPTTDKSSQNVTVLTTGPYKIRSKRDNSVNTTDSYESRNFKSSSVKINSRKDLIDKKQSIISAKNEKSSYNMKDSMIRENKILRYEGSAVLMNRMQPSLNSIKDQYFKNLTSQGDKLNEIKVMRQYQISSNQDEHLQRLKSRDKRRKY